MGASLPLVLLTSHKCGGIAELCLQPPSLSLCSRLPEVYIQFTPAELQPRLCKCLWDTPIGRVKVTSDSTRLSIITLTNDTPLCLFSHPGLETGTQLPDACSLPFTFLSCHSQILSESSMVDSYLPLLHLHCPASVPTLSISHL